MMQEMPPRFSDSDALIPAAGQGLRLGLGPKGLLKLKGRPLALWAAEAVRPLVQRVIIALPTDAINHPDFQEYEVIAGGASRQETVERLVAQSRARYVITHDAARPFASRALLTAVLRAAHEDGIAGAGIMPPVPLVRTSEDWVVSVFSRWDIRLLQSPQAFDRLLLQEMLERARREGRQAQSCLELFDIRKNRIRIVPGEETNIKISTPLDWFLARQALSRLFRYPGEGPQRKGI